MRTRVQLQPARALVCEGEPGGRELTCGEVKRGEAIKKRVKNRNCEVEIVNGLISSKSFMFRFYGEKETRRIV